MGFGLPLEGQLRPVARARAAAPLQPQPLPLQLALALELGNGDTGNQGPHQFDIARWGLKAAEPSREGLVRGRALRHAGFLPGHARRSDVGFRVLGRPRPRVRHARDPLDDEGTQNIGNLFYGSKGWVFIDGDGGKWQSYFGRASETGPGSAPPPASGSDTAAVGSGPHVLTIEIAHYQNFADAVRAGDPGRLNSEIEEGHLSTTLPHLGNIAYRMERTLRFDGKTETFPGDAEANALLTLPMDRLRRPAGGLGI